MKNVGGNIGGFLADESMDCGGNRGQRKNCEGGTFSTGKIPPIQEVVTARVADLQPARKHKDDKDGENGAPESIHDFGSAVCLFAIGELVCFLLVLFRSDLTICRFDVTIKQLHQFLLIMFESG